MLKKLVNFFRWPWRRKVTWQHSQTVIIGHLPDGSPVKEVQNYKGSYDV